MGHGEHMAREGHEAHAEHVGHEDHAAHAAPAAHAEHGEHADHAAPAAHAEHTGHEGHAAPAEHAGHEDHGAHVDHTGHEEMFRKRFWVSLVLTIPVLLFSPLLQAWLGFSMPEFPGSRWIGPAFALVIFLYGGLPFIQMAVPEVRNRKPGMMTLISLAISVAFAYSLFAMVISPQSSFFWEMATLIDIMLLGHWIEMRSVRQASGALNELAKLMPDTAERILPDGTTEVVSSSSLKEGDLVLVRPGASIPADGVVVEGRSDVNQAMLTGESLPVPRGPGDEVIAGTINGDGSLRIRVTATGEATALAGIMRLVAQAQQSKSKTQLLADRAAG
ncbi:MAG TPA: heavy metal translocating P-type ATPase, partial [Anaerolineales bacterium]|nr:heavy metal translocating P-type ATPase [Anaerolineales bacterium]